MHLSRKKSWPDAELIFWKTKCKPYRTHCLWEVNGSEHWILHSKLYQKVKEETCWDLLSMSTDNEQSYQSVTSICVNSFTWMRAAALLPGDKRQHIKTQFWHEKLERKRNDGTAIHTKMCDTMSFLTQHCFLFQSYLCIMNTGGLLLPSGGVQGYRHLFWRHSHSNIGRPIQSVFHWGSVQLFE